VGPADVSVRTLIGGLGGGIVAVGVVAWLVAPDRLSAVAQDLPEPVVLGAVLLFVTIAWLGAVWVLAKVVYRLWQQISPRVSWALELVFPDSPLIRFAAGIMLFVVVVIVLIGALPTLIGGLGDSGSGVIGFAEELSESVPDVDWDEVREGDAVDGTAACQDQEVTLADSDGDGLPDAWERRGETALGAPLPGADPDRKDLYVQVNYGSNVETLAPHEIDQLKRVWGRMPVQNPDGTTGIRLHVDDDSERAGSLGRPVEFADPDRHARFYTEDHLGDRQCIYHQVTYGRTSVNETVGYGSTPGYAVAVNGRTLTAYEGNVSFRVSVTTHHLLHNVAGRVDNGTHTSEGWLAGGPDQEFLSAATAAELNASGLFGPA
jgi:hypothetical protein